MARITSLLIAIFFSTLSFAQLREIPKTVQDAFQAQYPKAEKVEYQDNLIDVRVSFVQDSAQMIAKYTNKGAWKETEKKWSFDRLPEAIRQGFDKSKYADWKTTETAIVYLPGGSEQYRVKVEKGEITKRYLYFNKNGRLLREAITL